MRKLKELQRNTRKSTTKSQTFSVESKAWITPSPMGTVKEPRRRLTTSSLE
jgi:hypothetical protein